MGRLLSRSLTFSYDNNILINCFDPYYSLNKNLVSRHECNLIPNLKNNIKNNISGIPTKNKKKNLLHVAETI